MKFSAHMQHSTSVSPGIGWGTQLEEFPLGSLLPEPWDDWKSPIVGCHILSRTGILATGPIVPSHHSKVPFLFQPDFRIFVVSSSGGGLFGRPVIL